MTSDKRYYNHIVEIQEGVRMALIGLGELLNDVKLGQVYLDEIGQGCDTFIDFISLPEVGLTVREANELIKIFKFVDKNGVDVGGIPWNTIKMMAAKNITDKELIEDARHLTVKDFKERCYDKQTNDVGERTYTYMIMKRCNETGSLTRVYGIDDVEIKDVFNEKIENG